MANDIRTGAKSVSARMEKIIEQKEKKISKKMACRKNPQNFSIGTPPTAETQFSAVQFLSFELRTGYLSNAERNSPCNAFAFWLRVKPDRLAEYKKSHRHVWPEMLAALSRHGWTNYSIFLKSDGLLVGYVETPDFKKAVDGMQTEEINHRWQATMKELFTTLSTGAADTSLEVLEEVFHLD